MVNHICEPISPNQLASCRSARALQGGGEAPLTLDEQAAINVRRHLGVPHGMWLADFLFDREGPGILNWALEGLERLLKRGAFAIPGLVDAAIQRFKDESNPVSEF